MAVLRRDFSPMVSSQMTTYKSQARLEKINFDLATYSNVFLASEKAKLATIR